jgi:hypothetical protein
LIPSSHVTALVNGGRLNVIGSPVRRTQLPLPNSTRLEVGCPILVPPYFGETGWGFPRTKVVSSFAEPQKPILPLRRRHRRQAAMPRRIHRLHSEDRFIFGNLQRGPCNIAYL